MIQIQNLMECSVLVEIITHKHVALSCHQMCCPFVTNLSRCIALRPTPAASASILFGTAWSILCVVCEPVCLSVPVHVPLCVFVFCFVDIHQIKAVEHHNWLLHHHFSDMRLATERQMQRHSPVSQCAESTLSITLLNWY